MIDSILGELAKTTFDFRAYANPSDPLSPLFEEWVPYYRLKFAIARALQPKSILEVGVRFGYSARAFLEASPAAKLLGIDLDCDLYGGQKGALQWARQITAGYDAEFVTADTQQMKRLPGSIYDLIHVDGQQDGDGSWHDLELAVNQSRYVLAEGYFLTQQNFLSMTHFLYRFRDVLVWYCVIPGYAGELLIHVTPDYLEQMAHTRAGRKDSARLRETYTSAYYLQDCGGFDQYARTGGKRIDEDARLLAVAAIAGLKTSGRILDLGCGRGELAHYFAEQGFEVTAVDYSEAAIELVERTFRDEPDLRTRVELICSDVCSVPLSGYYDAAVASDVIEHLSPEELDRLYARVAKHLSADGIFVVHTYPNLWYFKYDYVKKRRIASAIGAYFPAQPRTRYERLMHINEQSPRVLKRSLKRHFNSVLLWFANKDAPGGSLVEKFSPRQMCAASDLFAVASHSSIDVEKLKDRFRSHPLPEVGLSGINLAVRQVPCEILAGNAAFLTLELVNGSPYVLASCPPYPVHISYHWLDPGTSVTVIPDGTRSAIKPPLGPGTRASFRVKVNSPSKPGSYILRVSLVQEFIRWFDEPPTSVMTDVAIRIR